jgi:N-acetylglucosaminyl-diphospho-decaprenol L-rhamnosyltransferase
VITVSIVSHGHAAMMGGLVESLLSFPEVSEIVLTLNIPEALTCRRMGGYRSSEIRCPEGFGTNHNAAFGYGTQPFFCLLNPDIRFPCNPFPVLLAALEGSKAALVAPLVKTPAGQIEDNIRHFPTPASLLRKAWGGSDGRYAVTEGQEAFYPEWVAGMFVLFRRQDYSRLHGFDEHFFLYYEDVDICVRAWQQGMPVLACPRAERDSRCTSLQSPQRASHALAPGQHGALLLETLGASARGSGRSCRSVSSWRRSPKAPDS